MPEHDLEAFYESPAIGPIEMWYDAHREPERRCAEMVLRAANEPSKTARQGFTSAAHWFALAAKEDRDAWLT